MLTSTHPRRTKRQAADAFPFLIYGTGIRNGLNPCACNTKFVLIYGNHPAGRIKPPAPILDFAPLFR